MEYDFDNWTDEQWRNFHSTVDRLVVYSDNLRMNPKSIVNRISAKLALETLEGYKTPKEV